jgi:glucose-1-phosphate thymidylyltransferase
MRGVILHGGRGTRLRPLTHTGPKQLIPIANKPMSQYALEDLREADITEIAIVLGDVAPEKVIDYYGDGSKFGVKLTYLHQVEPRGIAHAVGLTKDFVGDDSFVVYLGDNLIKGGIRDCVKSFESSKATAHIALCRVKNPESFGVAELDSKGKVLRLVEKPKNPLSDLALVGIYMFRPAVFGAIDKLRLSWRGELEITEAIQSLMDVGCEVSSHLVSGWWKDTGRPEDILEANQLVLSELEPFNKGTMEDGTAIMGRVGICEGTVIRKGCCLRGPAIIGKRCEIGAGTYIGPYTAVGDNVVIDGGEIENTIIMQDSIIQCGKRIVDSLIGTNSKIVSADTNLPRGYKLMVGENAFMSL